MKATSLSINLMGPCNARCPFCISSTTWKTGRSDNQLLRQSLSQALTYARYHQVDTVLITGSGEPTLQRDLVLRILVENNRVGIPITEIQTNGLLLQRDPAYLDELHGLGLNTVAISVSAIEPRRSAATMGIEMDYLALAREVSERGMLCRISLNLIDHDRDALLTRLADFADRLVAAGVKQLTLRQLGVPDRVEPSEEAGRKTAWIGAHALGTQDVETIKAQIKRDGTLLRRLSYGAAVYDYRDLSMVMTTCLTETQDPDEVRSLILMPDGHIYHSWNHPGSVIL